LRDANQNIQVNAVNQALEITTSSGGIKDITLASPHFQVLIGTATHTYRMPDATTVPAGAAWIFDNDSTQNLTVTNNAGATIDVVPPGGYATVFLELNSTIAGIWGRFGMMPNEVNWGTNSLDMGGSTIITNGIWQGTPVASAYGGTGLNSFSAANYALYSTSSSNLTAGTLPVAAGGTGVTTSTGSGNVVLSTSPTLVTPALGTPSSGDLSNCTGYPAGSVSGTVAIANGGTGQTTASAAFNALSPITTTGDLIIGNGSNSATRIGIGTNGQILTSNGTTATWEDSASGGGTVTTTDFTATASQTTFTVNYTVVGISGVQFTAPLIVGGHPTFPTSGARLIFTSVDDEHILTPAHLLYGVPGTNEACIYAGFGTAFATQFASSYMIIPTNLQLILDPENPQDYVYGGSLTTTTSTSDESLQVRLSVSMLNTTRNQVGEVVPSALLHSTEAENFLIGNPATEDYIPSSIIRALYDEIRQRQVRCDPGHDIDHNLVTFEIIGEFTDEVLDTFPIIDYQIQTDSGNAISIKLYGSDYFGPSYQDGPSHENKRELLLYSGLRGNSVGLNTLSKVALFVDNRNRTIGFGDPL
jgi:hypothetical protein